MRKIHSVRRSRNHQAIYMVITNPVAHSVEVWRCFPNDTTQMVIVRVFYYSHRLEDIDNKRYYTKDGAMRRAVNLADALSRMSVSEVLKQAENIRLYGEVK